MCVFTYALIGFDRVSPSEEPSDLVQVLPAGPARTRWSPWDPGPTSPTNPKGSAVFLLTPGTFPQEGHTSLGPEMIQPSLTTHPNLK